MEQLEIAILARLGGRTVPDASWQGLAVADTFRIGPGPVRVHLKIENTRALPRAYVLPRVQAFSPARHPTLTPTQHEANRDVDVHTHVLVEGEYVVRDGNLLGADMDPLRRDLARRARRLWPDGAG